MKKNHDVTFIPNNTFMAKKIENQIICMASNNTNKTKKVKSEFLDKYKDVISRPTNYLKTYLNLIMDEEQHIKYAKLGQKFEKSVFKALKLFPKDFNHGHLFNVLRILNSRKYNFYDNKIIDIEKYAIKNNLMLNSKTDKRVKKHKVTKLLIASLVYKKELPNYHNCVIGILYTAFRSGLLKKFKIDESILDTVKEKLNPKTLK